MSSRAPTTWAFDFSYITYGAMFLMAGAYTLSRDGHVRADVLYRLLAAAHAGDDGPRRSTSSSFCRPSAALIYSGWNYAAFSVRFREVSIFSPAGVPVFPLKALIPVTGVLLLLQGIAEIIRCILCIRQGEWPQRLHDVEETESDHPAGAAAFTPPSKASSAAGSEGGLSMTDPQVGMLMLGLFIFIIMLGFPIAFTLIAMGVGFGFYAYYTPGQDFFENRIFTLLVQKAFEVSSSDVLMAVPLFLFMGYLVERANILDRLFHSLQISMKNVPGALAVATLLTCAMFATATGIVGAVVTLMGLLAFPAMLRAGYDVKLSAGVVCAGGCLGILIPPSILLIVYAATAGVSAVKLYAAAFIPGFLLAGLYVVYIIVRAMINPALCPKLPKEQTDIPIGEVMWALATSFLPLALLIVSVLGAILFGLATPSEAAGAGALASIVLAAAYRALNFTDAEGFGLSDRARHRDGLLSVHRLVDVLGGVRRARRAAGGRGLHPRRSTCRRPVPAPDAGHHLPARLAAGMDRDHHHLRADLPAAAATSSASTRSSSASWSRSTPRPPSTRRRWRWPRSTSRASRRRR